MRGMHHVVINALLLSLASTYRGAGISAYQQHLLTSMAALQTNMTFTAVVTEQEWQAPSPVHTYRAPAWTGHPLLRILWEQVSLPSVLHRLQASLYHGLAFVAPLRGPDIPRVITVHDLSFVHFPETLPAWKARYLRLFTRLSLQRATRVITVSENTRRDVLRWVSLPEDRVVTVYNGVEERFRPLPAQDVARWRERRGLPKTFVLYLGTLQPRKNLETLIRAFAHWRQDAPPFHREVVLVLAGARGWFYDTLFRLVEDLGLRKHIFFPGYVPSDELPYWYNAATVFAYPSLFEGFGLPVLEAMACGTPVLAAATSSLPEIVGDAGILLPPDDVEAWTEALGRMLADPDLRATLAQAGRARASQFSWQRAARETLAVYRDALEASHG